MDDIRKTVDSGDLELYVLGLLSGEQSDYIEKLSETHSEIREELARINTALENYAHAHAIAPHETVKPFILATIDYSTRVEKGEVPIPVPLLDQNSLISDYNEWILREDMYLPADAENIYAKIIGHDSHITTAIVWIKKMAPNEIHHDELERFLVLEGSCQITIENNTRTLKQGDFLNIPLHKTHNVRVTSSFPCKVILQREKV